MLRQRGRRRGEHGCLCSFPRHLCTASATRMQASHFIVSPGVEWHLCAKMLHLHTCKPRGVLFVCNLRACSPLTVCMHAQPAIRSKPFAYSRSAAAAERISVKTTVGLQLHTEEGRRMKCIEGRRFWYTPKGRRVGSKVGRERTADRTRRLCQCSNSVQTARHQGEFAVDRGACAAAAARRARYCGLLAHRW